MPRTRTYGPTASNREDTYIKGDAWYVSPDWNATPTTVPISQTCMSAYSYKSMTDTITPKFHTLRNRGAIIAHPMSLSSVTGVAVPLTVQVAAKWQLLSGSDPHPWRRVSLSGQVSPALLGLGDASLPTGSGSAPTVAMPDTNYLVSQAYSRMTNQPLNLWVTAAEVRETIETIRLTLSLIPGLGCRRASQFLRKPVALKTLGRYVRAIPNLWLHLRYGLRPLIADLNGALKALECLGNKARTKFSSDEYTATDTHVYGIGEVTLNDFFHFDREVIHSKTVTARAGALAQPEYESLTLAQLVGMGNYVQAAWDIVPYSFVIDWFWNISDTLAAWAPDAYVVPKTDWVVVTTIESKTCRVKPAGLSSEMYWGSYRRVENDLFATGGYTQLITVTKERLVDQRLALTPTFKLRLGAAKVADLLALALQFVTMKS